MNSFLTLGIAPHLVAAIEKLGFQKPTLIQEKAIPVLLDLERDFIGLAQTGTGKTAAFGLPLLQQIEVENKFTQALVLAPTRELCMQITSDLEKFTSEIRGISIVAVYGGASIDNQIRGLKKGAHVVVATPGRLVDLIERRAAQLDSIEIVVLDEADEMLNMGFKEDIDFILEKTGEKRTWLFSATMPAEVKRISKDYMVDPFEVTVGDKNAVNANISHWVFQVKARDKYPALKRIIDFHPQIFGMIFTRTKIEAQDIAEKLIKEGYNADALHGDLSQAQRDKVMNRFRDRSLQLLIATDVAARGIDVDNITHVIQFGLPDELESYTHRAGRTARAGKTGYSIAIVHSKEMSRIKAIESKSKIKFERKKIPSGPEVCERQLFSLIDKMKEIPEDSVDINKYLSLAMQELKDLDRETLIKKFMVMEFQRFLDYYKNAPDLNQESERGEGRESRERGDFSRIFISIGELDGVEKTDLLKWINSLGLGRIEIGRIEIKRAFSFVEVEENLAQDFIEAVNGFQFDGRDIKAEMAEAKDGGGRSSRGSFNRGGGRPERSSGGGSYNRGGDRKFGNNDKRSSRKR
jgi:ATP-dependent RNA helicase DeaD